MKEERRRVALRWSIVALGLAAAACAGPDQAPQQTVPASVVLPAGDASAGRQAFIDLRCGACHAVPSEPSFAAPFSASPGPPIDARIGRQSVSYLVTAIMTPAHQLSPRLSEEERRHLTGTLSPMGDFSRVMTVRQLVDLHAYIHSRPE
jgi:hypothetical protein